MNVRPMMLGVGSVAAMGLAIAISLYSVARAQNPPQAGPRNFAPEQAQRPGGGQFGPGGSIAADQGNVYVLRGNTVFRLALGPEGRLRMMDRVDLPNGRDGVQNQNGQQRGRGNGTPPPPGKKL